MASDSNNHRTTAEPPDSTSMVSPFFFSRILSIIMVMNMIISSTFLFGCVSAAASNDSSSFFHIHFANHTCPSDPALNWPNFSSFSDNMFCFEGTKLWHNETLNESYSVMDDMGRKHPTLEPPITQLALSKIDSRRHDQASASSQADNVNHYWKLRLHWSVTDLHILYKSSDINWELNIWNPCLATLYWLIILRLRLNANR